MKTIKRLIIILVIISCDKEDHKDYNPPIGDWNIYPETLYEGSAISHFENGPISIDTGSIKFNEETILKPNHHEHEIYLNSYYLISNSDNLFELAIDNIPDEAYKMIYKSCQVDFTKISSITVSFHGESYNSEKLINDNDISALIRLSSCSNLTDNYFEIEKPLIISEDSNTELSEIWPDENFVNFKISELILLEEQRNEYLETNFFDINKIFVNLEDNILYKIKGNPNLSNMISISIGIKNPGDSSSFTTNDGLNKSIKVWIY